MMRRFTPAALALILWLGAQPSAWAQGPGTVKTMPGPDVTASATITASGQTQQMATGGRPSVSFTDVSDTFNGTFVFDVSSDGGTTWQSISVWDRTYGTFRTSVSTSPSRVGVSYVVTDLAGVSHVRIRSTSGSSGTLTGEFRATMGRILIDRVQVLGGTIDTISPLADVTTSTSFTASGQTASLPVTGRGSVGWTVTANTFDGNVITEASVDGGTTWSAIEIYDRTAGTYTTASLAPSSLTAGASFAVVEVNGVSNIRLRTTSGTTGTLSFMIRATPAANGPPPRAALKITDGTDVAQVTTTAGGSLQVECSTGCGGGTQYDQGTATTATDKLSMAGAVRHDTATVDGGVADGDRVTLSTDASGRLRVTAADTTQPISGSLTNISGTISLPTGASTLAEQQTQTTSLQLIDDVVHSNDAALGKVAAVGCQFDDTSPGTTTENNVRAVRCSTRREVYGQIRDAAGNERGANVTSGNALVVDGSASTQPVSGTVTANAGSGTFTIQSNASVNVNQVGGTTVVADPCEANAKTTTAISQTATTKIVTKASSKKNYICSIVIVANAAEVVSVWEGTQTTNPCDTSTTAVAGSTTAANGMSLAANGGFSSIGGKATVMTGGGTNVDVCVAQSGSSRVTGFMTWVQQ